MQNTKETEAIVQRFFLALDTLKDLKVIHGLTNFMDAHGINSRNFYQLRKNPSRGIFKVCWLKWIVEDYNLSATWLLTGNGGMFNRTVNK